MWVRVRVRLGLGPGAAVREGSFRGGWQVPGGGNVLHSEQQWQQRKMRRRTQQSLSALPV